MDDDVEVMKAGRGDWVQRARTNPRLIRLRHGVYTHREQWLNMTPWERYRTRIRAFRLTDPHAILSHESAAAALDLPVFREPARIHVFDNRGMKTGGSGDVIRHSSVDAREVVQTRFGPATSLIDTAVDLGRSAHRACALALWDATLARGVELHDIYDVARSQASRRGTKAIAWLRDRATAQAESAGESLSRAVIEWLGFETPTLQHSITTADGEWRADFAWLRRGIVGEFDGYAKYDRGGGDRLDTFRREKRREDAIRRSGFTVARWDYRDVVNPHRLSKILLAAGLPRIAPTAHHFLASLHEET